MDKRDLTALLIKEIENKKFNILEISGFKINPDLALLAGAAIGYQLGLTHCKQLLNKLNALKAHINEICCLSPPSHDSSEK